MISKRAGEPCIIQTFRQGGLTTPVLRSLPAPFGRNVPLTRGPLAGMHAPARLACTVAAVSLLSARSLDAQTLDRRQLERLEQTLRQEGEAVVALADAAADGEPVPADFTLGWHNDFLKAQTGTFVPFVVIIEPKTARADAALLYVRAARSRAPTPATAAAAAAAGARAADRAIRSKRSIPSTLVRGSRSGSPAAVRCSPGEYELTVVVREREREDDRGRRRAGRGARASPSTCPISRPAS